MNILALDSSFEVLSLALASKNEVFYTEVDSGMRHSELMMECADWLLKKAGLNPNDLNLVVCMKGPGSFTGLRIAYSAGKGLSLALGIPLRTVPTLDCIAYPFSAFPFLVIPVIDAKKGCFFSALYRDGKILTDYMDLTPEALGFEIKKNRKSEDEPIVLTGPGAELLFSSLPTILETKKIIFDPNFRKGKARELLTIAKGIIIEKQEEPDSGPLYIRKSDAELMRI